MENVQILDWEDDRTTRGIYIRKLHPDLNADGRRQHWENLLEVSCDQPAQTIDKGKVIFPKALGDFLCAIHHVKKYQLTLEIQKHA